MSSSRHYAHFLSHARTMRLAAMVCAAVAVLLLAPAHPPRWADVRMEMLKELQQRYAQMPENEPWEEDGGESEKAAPGFDFYYGSRWSGCGPMNVELMRMRAWLALPNGIRKATAGPDWTFIGPSNTAGRIRALVFDPADPNIVYAGAASGGVFKSVDGGLRWRSVMDDAPALPVGALAIHPSAPNTVYAGTGEPTIPLSRATSAPAYGGVGVMRSTDAGGTWELLPWPVRSSAISRIVLHPASPDTILVATRDGLTRSSDGGKSWQQNALAGVISDLAWKEQSTSTVFAAIGDEYGSAANGVYRSDANGRRFSWTRLSNNFPAPDSIGRIVLATTPADPNRLLALVAYPFEIETTFLNDFFVLMRSTDGGDTWERLPEALQPTFAQEQAHFDLCIAISPDDPSLVYAGGLEIWRSTNGGSGFMPMTFAGQVVHVDQHTLRFQNGGAIYVGNDGGVYRSYDKGFTWQRLDSTLATTQFYTVGVDRQSQSRLYGGTQDNGTLRCTGFDGKSWNTIRGNLDGGFVAADGNYIYSMGSLVRFPFRSTDGGQVWTDIGSGLGPSQGVNWLQPLVLHPTDRTRLYTATTRVYAATNVTGTATPVWSAVSGDLTSGAGLLESVVSTLAVAPSAPTWMYAATGDGRAHMTRNLYAASPAWTDISSGIPNRWITRIAVSYTDSMRAYLSCSGYKSGHVFLTTDGGAQWKDVSATLPDVPVNSIVVSRQRHDVVFAATDLGVWATFNAGGTWERYGGSLPNVVVYDLALTTDNRLIAATHGRGMWAVDATVGVDGLPLPSSFEVAVAPQPVTGTIPSLLLTLPAPRAVEGSVHDLTGARVAAIPRTRLQAGTHRMPLGSERLRPGVYLYCITADSDVRFGKFLVLY